MLVIGSEKLSDWLDMDDRSTCIIFADGAGAAVRRTGATEDEVGVGPVVWGAAGDLVSTIHIDETDALRQEGQAVFRWATTKIAPVALRAVEAAGLTPVRHRRARPPPGQPAHRRGDREAAAPGRGPDDLRVADDIQYSGNTSSASIPMAIDHMRGAGRVRSGDVALLVGFGAGLSYARAGRRPALRASLRCAPHGAHRDEHVAREREPVATNEEILPDLASIVEEVAGVDAAEVTSEKSFVDDLDIDSLSMVEIAVQAEDKFGVKIPDDELAKLTTVQDAVDYISSHS